MNVRNMLFGVCCLGACGVSACGTAESDTTEQSDAVLTSPLPVALRLTTIKMNGHSVNPALPVQGQRPREAGLRRRSRPGGCPWGCVPRGGGRDGRAFRLGLLS